MNYYITDEVLIEIYGYKRQICNHTNIPLTLTQKPGLRPIYHITDQEIGTVSTGFNEAKFKDISIKCALIDILAIIYYNKLSIPFIGLIDDVVLIQWHDGYAPEDEVEIKIRLGQDCTVVFWNDRLAFSYPKQLDDIYNKMISSKTLKTHINKIFL